jgi:hypothetical protein
MAVRLLTTPLHLQQFHILAGDCWISPAPGAYLPGPRSALRPDARSHAGLQFEHLKLAVTACSPRAILLKG